MIKLLRRLFADFMFLNKKTSLFEDNFLFLYCAELVMRFSHHVDLSFCCLVSVHNYLDIIL